MDTYERLREGMKWMWSLGDYREVAPWLEPHAEALAAACDIRPGMEVLDVAAGNGNFAIAAARRGAAVTASDLTPRMVELGRARSEAEGLAIEWLEFWERTNGPQMALKSMLPEEAYREMREQALCLVREMDRSDNGRLALDSEYALVLARKKERQGRSDG